MDDPNAGPKPEVKNLESRPPLEADLVSLCRELNRLQVRYVVVGGFAIISAGLPRMTTDIDLMVADDPDNERRLFEALAILPDKAVKELQPGELKQYNVIRVADEILVDLMSKIGGVDYSEAAKHLVIRELQGVPIPFASPQLLWRMKARTYREKDAGDLVFLREWFAQHNEKIPPV
jgi:hypothetical protein